MKTFILTLMLFSLFIPKWSMAQIFREVSNAAGLAGAVATNGAAVADYDNDGDLDIYFVAISQYDSTDTTTWNKLFRNEGNKTFTDVTVQAGVLSTLHGHPWSAMGNKFGAAWGDYNNDGFPDLFITNVGYDELYRNDGDGMFTDVTAAAGVKGNDVDHHSSALWWDYDLDGDLDLYVSAWIGENHLYENIDGETFVNVTAVSALGDTGRTWTSIPIDANNDHLPDLYVVNDFGANRFYLNQGDKTFRVATAEFGLEDGGHGMGVTIGDYDNNGFFDIYLTNIEGVILSDGKQTFNPLFANDGNGHFNNKNIEAGVQGAGWAWGAEFFDCDHDGDEDLYVVNGFKIEPGRNYFFLNDGSGKYTDRSVESQADGAAEARGLVVFDYDNDGDLDLLVANFKDPPYLYENQTVQQSWLQVNLVGSTSNRNAFGATVEVRCATKHYFRAYNGVDFLGQSVQPLHVGLADAEMADAVIVTWPDGGQEIVANVPVNQTVTIKQGQGLVVTSVVDKGRHQMAPDEFELLGNYPNPFNGSTVIDFVLPGPGNVTLSIQNIIGQKIAEIHRLHLPAGRNQISWQGQSSGGLAVSSGFYLYRLTWNRHARTGRMLYLK